MLNSLSSSRTKEMAPVSGFMYSRHESFTTSQLHKHKHTRNSSQEFLKSLPDRFLYFWSWEEDVGRAETWGCRWTEPSVSSVWDSFLCCLLKLIKKSAHIMIWLRQREKRKNTNGQTEERKEASVCQRSCFEAASKIIFTKTCHLFWSFYYVYLFFYFFTKWVVTLF